MRGKASFQPIRMADDLDRLTCSPLQEASLKLTNCLVYCDRLFGNALSIEPSVRTFDTHEQWA
jgi:hypothetical protein